VRYGVKGKIEIVTFQGSPDSVFGKRRSELYANWFWSFTLGIKTWVVEHFQLGNGCRLDSRKAVIKSRILSRRW